MAVNLVANGSQILAFPRLFFCADRLKRRFGSHMAAKLNRMQYRLHSFKSICFQKQPFDLPLKLRNQQR